MKRLLAGIILLLVFSVFTHAQSRKILVEKFTTAGCPGCPWGDYLLDSFLQTDTNFIPVGIHINDHWHPDSMWTVDGDSLLDDYHFAQPMAMIDRKKFTDMPYTPLFTSTWRAKMTERQAEPATISIGATTAYDPNSRSLTVTVQGQAIWNLEGDIRVNAYIMENSVTGPGRGYYQLNGYNNSPGNPLYGLGDTIWGYVHEWVLRDMLGGYSGKSGVVPNPISAGTPYTHTFNTVLDTAWNDANTYVVVLVQRQNDNLEQKNILNAEKLGLNASVLTYNETVRDNKLIQLFPNPAVKIATFEFPEARKWSIRIRDIHGKQILDEKGRGRRYSFPTGDWPEGLYFVEVFQEGLGQQVIKMLVQK